MFSLFPPCNSFRQGPLNSRGENANYELSKRNVLHFSYLLKLFLCILLGLMAELRLGPKSDSFRKFFDVNVPLVMRSVKDEPLFLFSFILFLK